MRINRLPKLIILVTLAHLFCFDSISQTCNPDTTYKDPGIFGDSIMSVVVDEYFEGVIHAIVPVDTNAVYLGVTVYALIDTIEVMEISGLPDGFTYACNPQDCKILGGDSACAVIFGTASSSQVGEYPLKLILKTSVTIPELNNITIFQNDTVTRFSLKISGASSSEEIIFEDTNSDFKIFPNPANKTIYVGFNAKSSDEMEFSLINLLGEIIFSETYKIKSGNNMVNIKLPDLKNGIYFCFVRMNACTICNKLIISN
jgi:hypothetical protein